MFNTESIKSTNSDHFLNGIQTLMDNSPKKEIIINKINNN